MSRQMSCLVLVALVLVVTGCFGRSSMFVAEAENDASAETGEIGTRDFSFADPDIGSTALTPTGHKPQSKLWYNDGSWWGVLFDRSSEEYHIHRFDEDAQSWSDTGTLVDRRDRSRADVLWDGTHLYVVSAAPNSTGDYASARLRRYSYDPALKIYSRDQGFPVTVTDSGVEAIVLAKDTTGTLWVTYTQNGQVLVNRSLGDDRSWDEPFVLPAPGAAASPDDISSVISFDGQIGVMWSNQVDDAFYFATHLDGDPDSAWQTSVAAQGPDIADDHLSLKSDSEGSVYAAVKTTLDESTDRDPNAPLILLLVRSPSGAWTSNPVSRVATKQTRPIVQIDEDERDLYVFASAPCCRGGSIYYKKTGLDNISFPEGRGDILIESETDTHINDATSTKQNASDASGLMILASDSVSGYYWHNSIRSGVAE